MCWKCVCTMALDLWQLRGSAGLRSFLSVMFCQHLSDDLQAQSSLSKLAVVHTLC